MYVADVCTNHHHHHHSLGGPRHPRPRLPTRGTGLPGVRRRALTPVYINSQCSCCRSDTRCCCSSYKEKLRTPGAQATLGQRRALSQFLGSVSFRLVFLSAAQYRHQPPANCFNRVKTEIMALYREISDSRLCFFPPHSLDISVPQTSLCFYFA